MGINRVKTRLQVQVTSQKLTSDDVPSDSPRYTSTMDAINKIVADEGIAGLYSGIHGSLLGVASTNFAYFYWYSIVRTLYIKSSFQQPPGTATELALGAAAGAVAQVFTIPVAVVTTRQQTQPKGDKKSLMDTGREVVNSEDGWTGLWRGLKASLVLVINPAITYGAYQRLKDGLFPGKKSLKPWEAFGMFWRSLYRYAKGEAAANTVCSFGCHVKGSRDDCHPAIDRGQGRPPVSSASGEKGQAVQKLCRSHALHHRARRRTFAFQGNRTPDHERAFGPGPAHDDKGEVKNPQLQLIPFTR